MWIVDSKIASGGFGSVYKGHHMETDEIVAIKTEKKKNKINYLDKEIVIYRAIGESEGFPRLRWTGRTKCPIEGEDDECMVMVIDFLGLSLSDLFYKNKKSFSLKTVLLLADQMIDRLETLHKRNVVHRDIKPGNFVMGTGGNASKVYLLDFGLAHLYRNSDNKHIPYDDNVPFRGTHRYASINAHDKIEQTRRDDLESLGYVLIYFLKGSLPWQNQNVDRNKRRVIIGELKKKTSIAEITCGLPSVFEEYLKVVRLLQFDDKPDYKRLKELFRKCLADHNYLNDGIYDWSQEAEPPSKRLTRRSSTKKTEFEETEAKKQMKKNTKKRKKSLSEEEVPKKQKQKMAKKDDSGRTSRRSSVVSNARASFGSVAVCEVIEISDDSK
uniref:non-specific serine/threonine protein kinase n=1 Tax=Arcella intermedia TaxID=1963864 RepID=A0A6B2L6I2_9EUKA